MEINIQKFKIYLSKYTLEQKIIIPNGKCLKQVGTYQYEAKNCVMKTVPAVEIK